MPVKLSSQMKVLPVVRDDIFIHSLSLIMSLNQSPKLLNVSLLFFPLQSNNFPDFF